MLTFTRHYGSSSQVEILYSKGPYSRGFVWMVSIVSREINRETHVEISLDPRETSKLRTGAIH